MTTLKVKNMSCEHCVKRINEALDKAKIKHEIDLSNKSVKVEADKIRLLEVFDILEAIGYEAEVLN
ncbi:MAG: heavy-metal-associated domain-containing protein [Sphaerochaetaceae bacterium]|nr:heavy-metal-associated domain-containing protein [Sphaerochaetaceae bacterium]